MSGEVRVSHATDESQRQAYRAIIEGERRTGPMGSVLFCVSSDDLTEGKGDLFVALGLARALNDLGWGVSLWPLTRVSEQTPAGIDVAIFMIESIVPGLVHPETKSVAWIRNWTDRWARLPYLGEFAQIWCSSAASAAEITEHFTGPTYIVPIATDLEIFGDHQVERRADVVTTANFWGIDRSITAALGHVATEVPVTWYGANSEHLRAADRIDHRDQVDYFALPAVYSSHLVVVDDMIDAAARYGNQNSRLFDSLSCGAMVVTNSSNGLDELGLSDVPAYTDERHLLDIVRDLVAAPDRTRERAAQLQAVVRERHSYAARAALVSGPLTALATDRTRTERGPLLQWMTLEQEKSRSILKERDDWRALYYALQNELAGVRSELEDELRTETERADDAEQLLHGIRTSRSYRLADRMVAILHAVARRLPFRRRGLNSKG